MRCGVLLLLVLLPFLLLGCATTRRDPIEPFVRPAFPPEALMTHRAVLTARGRQFALTGYLAVSEAGGKRLIVTQSLGQTLADVLVKPDGTVHVIRSSPLLRPAWIQRHVAADLNCLFGAAPGVDCPVRAISTNHFLIERRWYTLELRIVEIKTGPQPPNLFQETPHSR